ncbi:MAG: glycosyltransferase family 2 protein [Leptospirales bacterium]
MKNIKFSIITVCFNSEATIERTLISVQKQNYSNVEHVIIDGGSKDSTLAIIKKHRKSIAYFVSEPDKGIYDAMNKGVAAAKGDVLLFLNSDDSLVDNDVLTDVANQYEEDSATDVVYGDVIYTSPRYEKYRKQSNKSATRWGLAKKIVQHQTLFVKKQTFLDSGGYDLKYRIIADYDWELKLFILMRCKYQYIPTPIAYVQRGGESSKFSTTVDRLDVMQKVFSPLEIIIFYRMRKFFRKKILTPSVRVLVLVRNLFRL